MGSGAANPMAIKFEGHLRQIQDFIDGIREQRPFFIEGSEARKAVALVRAIYDSAATGQPGASRWRVRLRRFTRLSRNVHKSLMQSAPPHAEHCTHGSEAISPAAGLRMRAVFHR